MFLSSTISKIDDTFQKNIEITFLDLLHFFNTILTKLLYI